MHRTPALVALITLATGLAVTPPATAGPPAAAGPAAATTAMAVRAPAWDALFDRSSGWTGADGIYSIPLSGDERPGSAAGGTTFWTFSDTFIGQVDDADHRESGSVLVNNTMALLEGARPDPSRMQFFWKTAANGAPQPQVVPDGPDQRWFWPNDGIAIDGQLYLYSLRMKPGTDPVFNFAIDGISLLSSPADSNPPFATYTQVDAPLYAPATDHAGDLTFGQAVLPNTTAAGAPDPDGYLYVYGVRNDLRKKLLVSRVRPDHIADFASYRFWDGRAWSPSLSAAVPVTSRISSEFSVSPLPDGRYLLVFQLDALSGQVAVRYGDSPVGPWGPPTVIWNCPEDQLTRNTYTYNAKAHPALSQPGRLLISYNVNTFKFAEHFSNADIYRPRFIWLPLP